MPGKVIARANAEDEVFEVYFSTPISRRSEEILRSGLSGIGLTVNIRRPDATQTIWECHPPAGVVVTDGILKQVEGLLASA